MKIMNEILPRWTPVINFYRDSSSFIPLLLVVSLLISSFLDLVILLSLNAVVLVLLNGLSLRCSTGFSKKRAS